jgi:hypothetical protein
MINVEIIVLHLQNNTPKLSLFTINLIAEFWDTPNTL